MALIPRGMCRWTAAAFAIAIVVLPVRTCDRPDPPETVVPDTASASAYRARIAELEHDLRVAAGERGGLRGVVDDLRNRLAGVEERRPGRITVYDTLTTFERDTIQLAWSIDDGALEIIGAVPVPGGHQPVEVAEIDVRDCDDGIRTVGLRVICDRARFGHLSLIARGVVGAAPTWPPDSVAWRAEAGLRWSASHRSSTAIELVGSTTSAIEAGFEVNLTWK